MHAGFALPLGLISPEKSSFTRAFRCAACTLPCSFIHLFTLRDVTVKTFDKYFEQLCNYIQRNELAGPFWTLTRSASEGVAQFTPWIAAAAAATGFQPTAQPWVSKDEHR